MARTAVFAVLLLSLAVIQLPLTIRIAETIGATADDPNSPSSLVRLIFIHHSTGENWLVDDNGGLGLALGDNNYYVSDTNYGWGPDSIGDNTDMGQWWLWFRSHESSSYLAGLYAEEGQYSEYSRMESSPGGENEIVMFKSCFPNSALMGDPDEAVPSIDDNPLRGEFSGSEYHTVANAKGIYLDILEYFRTRPDKLFIVVTAPPLSDPAQSSNARAFNEWLVNEWLNGYPYRNVFVFDFYNVLTTNGGNPDKNDLSSEVGNHHRWWGNAIQHKTDGDNDANPNVLEYPSEDDHPSRAGNLKATAEFLPLLNMAYNRWKGEAVPSSTVATTETQATQTIIQETVETSAPESEVETTEPTEPPPEGGGFQLQTAAALTILVVVILVFSLAFLAHRRRRRPRSDLPSPTIASSPSRAAGVLCCLRIEHTWR